MVLGATKHSSAWLRHRNAMGLPRKFNGSVSSMKTTVSAGNLSNAQNDLALLTAVLMSRNSRTMASRISRHLIGTFGSLPRVLCAAEEDLASFEEVGRRNAAIIKASHATILHTVLTPVIGNPMINDQTIATMVLWTIGQSLVEKVQLIYLDKRHIVTGNEVICSGSGSFVSISCQTVIHAVLRHGAAKFIIAHNHPHSAASPSDNDLKLTREIYWVTKQLELTLLDHIIVARGDYLSLKSLGYL